MAPAAGTRLSAAVLRSQLVVAVTHSAAGEPPLIQGSYPSGQAAPSCPGDAASWRPGAGAPRPRDAGAQYTLGWQEGSRSCNRMEDHTTR